MLMLSFLIFLGAAERDMLYRKVTLYAAQKNRNRRSAIDARPTRHVGLRDQSKET
jgi:hypothetical protein